MNKTKRDCVIVCGYPTNDDGTISSILKSRISCAIELYHQGIIQYVLVSGGAIHNQYEEANCMKEYALCHGVSEECIIVENQAKSTYHNMLYASELMKQYHCHDCYVVTNSWHMIKAQYYANKFHLDFVPVKAKKPEGMSYLKVLFLTIEMPINMLINRLKGYY